MLLVIGKMKIKTAEIPSHPSQDVYHRGNKLKHVGEAAGWGGRTPAGCGDVILAFEKAKQVDCCECEDGLRYRIRASRKGNLKYLV